MKVERLHGCFNPIIITLENVNEALMIGEALRTYERRRKDNGITTLKDEICRSLLEQFSAIGY